MDYGHPFQFLRILTMLLYIGCAVAVFVRWRARAATYLAAAGFGTLLLTDVLFFFFDRGYSQFAYEVFRILPYLRVLGPILILVGLFLSPVPGSAPPPSPLTAPMGAVLPPSRYRPGWALVTWWIVLSALGLVGGIVTLLVFLASGSSVSDSEMEMIMLSASVSMLFVLPSTIIYLIWLYQAWDSVPETYRSASPGQAVGFLFIPFFNLYWVFRAVPGLSASIGRAMQAHDPKNVGAPGYGMGIAACVIALVPYVNVIAWPFFLTWVCQTNGARNRMLAASGGPG